MELQIDMSADVLFDFNKANILPKTQEALKRARGHVDCQSQNWQRLGRFHRQGL